MNWLVAAAVLWSRCVACVPLHAGLARLRLSINLAALYFLVSSLSLGRGGRYLLVRVRDPLEGVCVQRCILKLHPRERSAAATSDLSAYKHVHYYTSRLFIYM